MEKESAQIRTVIRWTNDNVMVFDQFGAQMLEYQGRWEDVRQKIVEDAPPDTIFQYASWSKGNFDSMTKEDWLSGAHLPKREDRKP